MDSENFVEYKIDSSKKLFDAIVENEIIVLKFSASWCKPCQNKKFKNNFIELKKRQKNVRFIEFDIDKDESIINDKNYYDISVNSVPYFLLGYNKNFIKEYSGTNSLEEIENDISTLMN